MKTPTHLKARKKRKPYITTLILAGLFIIAAGVLYFAIVSNKRASAPVSPVKRAAKATPQLSPIDTKLSHMSLHDKVASLLILHQAGTDPQQLQNFVATYKPGGFILMGDNIPASSDELQHITDMLGDRLVAIDEEGGTVQRLKGDTFANAETLKSLPVVDTTDAFLARSTYLQQLGITLNFGIIADTTNDPNSFIYSRVLGTSPANASDRVAAAVRASSGKTLSTLKHFPGHGETEENSHITIPVTGISFSEWQQRDKPPFQAGIKAGANVVMMGHLAYSAVDSAPASLSKKWHDILRSDLGFKGIIVTDDMFMLQDSGEPAYENLTQNAVSALQAGNTMLLYVTDHDEANTKIDPTGIIDAIVSAVENGTLQESAITANAKLVLETQQQTLSFQ